MLLEVPLGRCTSAGYFRDSRRSPNYPTSISGWWVFSATLTWRRRSTLLCSWKSWLLSPKLEQCYVCTTCVCLSTRGLLNSSQEREATIQLKIITATAISRIWRSPAERRLGSSKTIKIWAALPMCLGQLPSWKVFFIECSNRKSATRSLSTFPFNQMQHCQYQRKKIVQCLLGLSAWDQARKRT